MNKKELKAALRPLIKDGILSSLIKEVMRVQPAQVVTEAKAAPAKERLPTPSPGFIGSRPDPAAVLAARKRKLLGSIGAEAYNGINVFEGTTPLTSREAPEATPGQIDLGASTDAGVDIGNLFASSGNAWSALSGGMKK